MREGYQDPELCHVCGPEGGPHHREHCSNVRPSRPFALLFRQTRGNILQQADAPILLQPAILLFLFALAYTTRSEGEEPGDRITSPHMPASSITVSFLAALASDLLWHHHGSCSETCNWGSFRQLHRDKDVIFAGYRAPHPLQHKVEIRVRAQSSVAGSTSLVCLPPLNHAFADPNQRGIDSA